MVDEPHATWELFADELRQYVRRRIADTHACDDIVQDVFLKLASTWRARPPGGPLHAWIFRVAHNAIVDHYRAGARAAATDVDVDSGEPTPAARAENAPLIASFRAFVHSLPPEQREAILLTEYEGLSQKELAARLGVPVSTVKSRVQRGRRRLARTLSECCTFEFDRCGKIVDWHRRPGGACRDC